MAKPDIASLMLKFPSEGELATALINYKPLCCDNSSLEMFVREFSKQVQNSEMRLDSAIKIAILILRSFDLHPVNKVTTIMSLETRIKEYKIGDTKKTECECQGCQS